MTSPIGNKAGFTFIEVMVAVSILALGTVVICQANLTALNAYSRYTHRLGIRDWAETKLWEAKEKIMDSDFPEGGKSSGEFKEKTKSVLWVLDVEPYQTPEVKDFYSVDLKLTWEENNSPLNFSYASLIQKMKKS